MRLAIKEIGKSNLLSDVSDHVSPVTPAPDPSWMLDSRYLNAKALYDCNAIDVRAFTEICTMCQADSVPRGSVPAHKATQNDPNQNDPTNPDDVATGPSAPKRPKIVTDEYDSEDDQVPFEPEPDFGDLISCIVQFYPKARESDIKEKAHEFLFGAAAVSNRREFVRLKLYSEITRKQGEINERVSKVSLGANKQLAVWPRKRSYYKVHELPETIKINPCVA